MNELPWTLDARAALHAILSSAGARLDPRWAANYAAKAADCLLTEREKRYRMSGDVTAAPEPKDADT